MGGIVELDPLYEQAKEVILTDKKTSISYLQRKLSVGYNRSANIIEQLEKMGVLTPPNAKGQREIAV
jgi:S-DNA-T family DNA segregation ATPase FtsK/SpoIIIE